MTLRLMKASAAALWILGVFVFFVLASRAASSMPNGIAIAAIAIFPPILLWFWWNDPEPTMSESIHEVRDAASRDRGPRS